MQTLKLTIAEQCADKLRTLNPDGAPAAADIAAMLEYPPTPRWATLRCLASSSARCFVWHP